MMKQILLFTCLLGLFGLQSSVQRTANKELLCDSIYSKPEVFPQYPGAIFRDVDSLLNDYFTIEERIRTSTGHGIPGRTVCSFIVDKEGNIRNPAIVRALDPCLDKTALLLIPRLKRFIPGKHQGKPVCVRYILPIRFHY